MFVTLPNSSQVRVQFVGTVVLCKHLILYDVYFVPGFCFNLISVSALFNALICPLFLTHNHSKLIGRAKLLEGLYFFKVDSSFLRSSDLAVFIASLFYLLVVTLVYNMLFLVILILTITFRWPFGMCA